MAYELNKDEEEEDGRRGEASPGGPDRPSLGAAAPATPGTPQPRQTGTGFVGWEQILNANKDAATAQAGNMASGLAGAGEDVKRRQGLATEGFNTAVDAARPARPAAPVGQDSRGAPTNAFGQPTGTPAPAGMRGAPPTQGPPAPAPVAGYGRGQTDPAALKARAGATYQGPNSLAESTPDWADILGDGQEAQRRAGAVQTEGGIEAMLQEGNPSLGAGSSGLDAALLGATGRRRFDELQKDYGGLVEGLGAADTTSKARADEARGAVAADAAQAAADYEAWDKPFRESSAKAAGMDKDAATYTKGYIGFAAIQAEKDPQRRMALIQSFNRKYGDQAYDAALRHDQVLRKDEDVPKNADGSPSVHWKFE